MLGWGCFCYRDLFLLEFDITGLGTSSEDIKGLAALQALVLPSCTSPICGPLMSHLCATSLSPDCVTSGCQPKGPRPLSLICTSPEFYLWECSPLTEVRVRKVSP